jgi:hypothetical protein
MSISGPEVSPIQGRREREETNLHTEAKGEYDGLSYKIRENNAETHPIRTIGPERAGYYEKV